MKFLVTGGAGFIGSLADGVILVLQAGRTQRDLIKHAEQRLAQAHAKVLGYIITNVEYHLPQYLYRYVHKYGEYGYKESETVALNR